MKILVTGASGFIGQYLIEKLSSFDVSILGRKNIYDSERFTFFEGQVSPDQDYTKSLVDIDVVISLAGRAHVMNDDSGDPLEKYREVNRYGTLNLAKQASAIGVKRFIYLSSIKVNGESTEPDRPFYHDSLRQPQDYYGQSKAEAELDLIQLAEKDGMEVVIIRPTLVYGPKVKANFHSLMKLVYKRIPLPFGRLVSNKRSLISLSNLSDLIVTCIEHPSAANQVFLASDDMDISTSELASEIAKALNLPTRQLNVPLWLYNIVGKIMNKSEIVDRLTGSLQVDIEHTKKLLDWTPKQTLKEGFTETANCFLIEKGNSK